MENKKSKEINEQIEYGFNSIDSEAKIEVSLRDFMLIYKTFAEFNRFFHQPLHYPTIEDIEIFLGNRNFDAYSIIRKIYYDILDKYIPKEIEDKFGEENDQLSNPHYPYYYKVKNDENIDDGTLKVNNKDSFIKFAKELLKDFKTNGENWENNRLEDFIGGIVAYAEDIDGYYKNMKFDTSSETPTWRIFAQILKGAAIYE
jgi:hypothetical protein